MELFFLTFVSRLTLELRPVLTSLPYFKPFWVDLMGTRFSSQKEGKTLFTTLLWHALTSYAAPYFHYIFPLQSSHALFRTVFLPFPYLYPSNPTF